MKTIHLRVHITGHNTLIGDGFTRFVKEGYTSIYNFSVPDDFDASANVGKLLLVLNNKKEVNPYPQISYLPFTKELHKLL
jgi:hypothetical protein